MRSNFYIKVKPLVDQELTFAKQARKQLDKLAEFNHLDNAHILAQTSTLLHTKVHVLMLYWAIRHLDVKECLGQGLRIFGATTKTVIGFIPFGNTGGANISPFRVYRCHLSSPPS